MSLPTVEPKKVIATVLATIVVISVASAVSLGAGVESQRTDDIAGAGTLEEGGNTTVELTTAENIIAERQEAVRAGNLPSELKGPLRQSRADVNLSRELVSILDTSSKSRRTATLDASAKALSHRTRQARFGNLRPGSHHEGSNLVSSLEQRQSDLRLARDLLGILDNESTTRRTAILNAADRSLESHRQQAIQTGSLPTDSAPFFARGQGKVAAAGTLADAIEARSEAGDLQRAVSIALTAERTEAGPLGGEASTARSVNGPDHAKPSAAAFDLLDRHGVTPTEKETGNIQALDDLPEPSRSALTDFLNAYIAYEKATSDAFEDVNRTRLTRSWTPVHNTRFDLRESDVTRSIVAHKIVRNNTARESMKAAGVDVSRVVSTRDKLLTASKDLESTLEPGETETSGTEPVRVDGVLAIDLRESKNTYTDNYALVLDGGGSDTYQNNAGGNNLADHTCDTNVTDEQVKSAALVDLGGDDVYAAARGCGQRGGAQLGSGFLLDAGGDDTYTDRNENTTGTYTWGDNVNRTSEVSIGIGRLGTNGGGAQGGIGFLLDVSGDDSYEAGWEGTNGGGYVQSTGFLLDASGDDTYSAGDMGTNGGGAQNAMGFLMDGAGNDTYMANSGGTNGGGALQGEGFLLDTGGSDTYTALAYGMIGGSYAGGEGFLVDTTGSDMYLRGAYSGGNCRCYGPSFGILGGSFGGGVGFLLDATGNDSYTSGFDGANGGGQGTPNEHVNISAGFLFDGGGSDTYKAAPGGTNGGAVVQGRGFLVDAGGGSDTYTAGGDGSNGGATGGQGARGGMGDMSGGMTFVDFGGRMAQATTYGGFLLDQGGNDNYTGGNGGGRGFLLDGAGSDTYSGRNGGSASGVGFLLDLGRGNDTYKSEDTGTNGGGADGGVGFLVDAGGQDNYTAGKEGTNGGGNKGVGFLLDGGGSDTYNAERVGTNGGSRSGRGLLIDAGESDDTYTAGTKRGGHVTPYGGTNGGGYGNGSGMLYDTGGNDSYTALFAGTNGGGANGASGLLIDGAGNDSYTGLQNGTNGGGESAVGLLLDASGHDSYEDMDGGTGTDRTMVPKGDAGAQMDNERGQPVEEPSTGESNSDGGLLDVVVSIFDTVSELLQSLVETLPSASLLHFHTEGISL